MSYSAVDKDERYDSIIAKKILNLPVINDLAVNTTNVSFNEGSTLYDRMGQNLYFGNGSTLLKVINEDENGNVIFDGDIVVDGDSYFNGNIFANNVEIDGQTTFNGDTTFNGTTNTINNDLVVGGNATINELTVTGTSTFGGNTTFNGATNTIANNLEVDGNTTFNGATNTFSNGVTVNGASTFNDDVTVNGTSTFNDDTAFNGDINTVSNSLRANVLGFTNDGATNIYVDSTNGNDSNIGTDLSFPKKTLIDAINSVGARPNAIINLLPGNYVLDGNDPTIYSNSIENKLFIRGYNYPYTVTSTHTVNSTTAYQYGVSLEVTKVDLFVSDAPASPSGQWVRINGNYYPIITTVLNTSVTIITDTVPPNGTVFDIVTPTVNVTVSDLEQVLGDLFMCDMHIINSSTDTISQDVGIMHFARVYMELMSGIDVGNGGTLEYNYCVLSTGNASSLSNAGSITFNRTVYIGTDVNSLRGIINNYYSYLNFNNYMNVGSVYNSEGGNQLGTFDARYSITYFNGIGYNNNAQDYFYLQNSQFETVNGCEFVCEKEYRFQTCRVYMNFNSSVGFVGRSVPVDPQTNPIPALLQFVHYCNVVILGGLSLQYNDASVNGFAYLNSDQFSKVHLKPTSLIKTNGGNPRSAFYVNIMSDLVVNTTVINSNLDGSNPAGSKLQIRTFYFGMYPDIDNTWIDYELSDTSVVPTLVVPPPPTTVSVTTAGGQFSRVASVT